MELAIFIVGFVVTMSAVYGIFAQVPMTMVGKEDSPTDLEKATTISDALQLGGGDQGR